MTRVLIAAPLRQKPEIFAEYQKSIDRLIVPHDIQIDRFFIVNDCSAVIPLLHDCKYIEQNFRQEMDAHFWTASAIERMFLLRDAILEYALREGYDFVLSTDTDLVLDPNTVYALLEAKKDIVAEVFWTADWCNAWMFDMYDTANQMDVWKKPGLYPVGMSGALMLISRQAIIDGCRYQEIPNIKNAFHGEDRHFCVRAACAGYQIWLDTRYPATHLYDDAAFLKYKEKTYGNNTFR